MQMTLCYHNGKYNFYTPVMDAFCYIDSLSIEQVRMVTEKEYGKDGLERLPERLERAHKNGHSAHEGGNLEEFLSCNRAGDNEKHLSFEECIRQYLS